MAGFNALISGIASQTTPFRFSPERKETKQQPKQNANDDAVRITLSRQTSPASDNASEIAKSIVNPAGNLRGYAKASVQVPQPTPEPKPLPEAAVARLPEIQDAKPGVIEKVDDAPVLNEGETSFSLAAKGQLVDLEA